MRYLAIDYGGKRTGLAICDEGEAISSPLQALATGKNLINEIVEVITEQNVGAVVIGLPLNMDDTEGPAAKCAHRFGSKLKKCIDIPIYFHDERLSSFDAERKLAGQMTRKKKKARIDAIAAATILQSFLDSKHQG